MAKPVQRLGEQRTAMLAIGGCVGALLGVLIADRLIHYSRQTA